MADNGYDTINKYDRLYASMRDVALFTKPSTIKLVQPITGRAESFIIETCRQETGDVIFIERTDEDGVVRLYLPPKVVSTIVRQRDALTKRSRSMTSKRVMAERMASGDWKPPVPPRRKK